MSGAGHREVALAGHDSTSYCVREYLPGLTAHATFPMRSSTRLGLFGVAAVGNPPDRSAPVRTGTTEKGYSVDWLSLPLRRRRARYATTAPTSRSFPLDTLRPEDRLSSEVSASDSVSSRW